MRLSKRVLSTAEGHERARGPVTAVFRLLCDCPPEYVNGRDLTMGEKKPSSEEEEV
jgi:hypothetical protein